MLSLAIEVGLDVGQVVQQGTIHDDSARVSTTGANWVRINFRLDSFTALDDDWFAAYDQIVDAYLARGIQVYGLINDEALSTDAPHASDAWIAAYRDASLAIVDHFKDRVRVYELINEPNDFAGGDTARFPPDRFAKAVQDTYTAIKRDHAGDRCWQVDLVSGPLLSFDGTTSADYLQATVDAWAGDLPLDGIGYHMYVAQGLDSSDADVATSMQANLDAVSAVLPMPIYVSEFGWRATLVGPDVQAARMQVGANAMAAHGDVALAIYFTEQDFPDNTWGVFDDQGARRPSADMLASLASANLPARFAVATATAGDGEVIVTVQNRGSSTWPAGGSIRLGAASGCPDATSINAIDWAPAQGYATSQTDARLYLPADVAPGASVDLHVPVTAPPGTYHFAARMVDDGVAWFGTTASVDITIPDAMGSNDGPTTQPAGCAAGGGGIGTALGVLALTMRRRRRF